MKFQLAKQTKVTGQPLQARTNFRLNKKNNKKTEMDGGKLQNTDKNEDH